MENVMRIKDKVYEIPDEYIEQAKINGISKALIRMRIRYGWTLKEACFVPRDMKVADFRYMEKMKKKDEEDRNRFIEEKRRRDRPWLYDGTPQVHKRNKWCVYLMENDIFPKAVH